MITTISDKESQENSGGSHPPAFRWWAVDVMLQYDIVHYYNLMHKKRN